MRREYDVVVWCKSTIKYNVRTEDCPALEVVVWCKSTIKYNEESNRMTRSVLWFGVRVL